jgi:K+-transporting ATPase KdpF subunit
MGGSSWVAQHFGLTILTVVCLALTFYLVYAMIHPEEF